MRKSIEYEELGLGNVGGPELEEQFADHLDRIREAFRREEDARGGRKVKATINVSVTLTFDPGTGVVTRESGTKLKLPPHRTTSGHVVLDGDAFYVEPPDSRQLTLHDAIVGVDAEEVS